MPPVTLTRNRQTAQEYLRVERAAAYKSEYRDGDIVAMAGATREHNLICHNLSVILDSCLADSDCEIYAADMRVWIPRTQLYTYPDVVVVCGEPLFEDERRDNLLNPALIIEVLSESTSDYDQGRKFENYKSIASLREYLLVWQDEPRVRVHRRNDTDQWQPDEAQGMDGEITLATGCELSLARLYRRITFAGQTTTR